MLIKPIDHSLTIPCKNVKTPAILYLIVPVLKSKEPL